MRINKVLCLLNLNSNKFYNMQLHIISKKYHALCNIKNIPKLHNITQWHLPKKISCIKFSSKRYLHEDVASSDDELDTETNSSLLDSATIDQKVAARNLLYKNTTNPLLLRIKNSASVEEVLSVFNFNHHDFDHRHVAQTILVLNDIFEQFKTIITDEKSDMFLKQLHESAEFQNILAFVENNLSKFDANTLSYVLCYLMNLGLKINSKLYQLIVKSVKDDLEINFDMSTASRFLKVVCSEHTLRPFFIVQPLIPLIYDKMETNDLEEFENLTICLNKMNKIVSHEVLTNYKKRVENFIDSGTITHKNHKLVLKILMLLNYPYWREASSPTIIKCIDLLRGNLHLLNPYELSVFFEIFYKQQEPGYVLSELQRYSAKYLTQNEEEIFLPFLVQLKLFSSIIYFSSPQYRILCKDEVYKFVEKCDTFETLILLRKILSYVKTSDKKLCEAYWKKIITRLHKADFRDFEILKMALNYMNFNIDINDFRHEEFENVMLHVLWDLLQNSTVCLIPQNVSNVVSFMLLYGNNTSHLNYGITKLEDNIDQINCIDCLLISKSLNLLYNSRNKRYISFEIHRLNKLLNGVTEKEITKSGITSQKLNMLLKACVFRNASDNLIVACLKRYIDCDFVLSTKSLESVLFCAIKRNILIPEAAERIVDFVITNNDKILGYNMEKIVFSCYNLGYTSEKIDVFLKCATDVLIRDQDRLTGLSTIRGALALSFYNSLPHSFIKKIFNVEFLDKLDLELDNCYSKDYYPQRVRNSLMELNRVVCLSYPEANVPWFHQKYMDVAKNKVLKNLENQKLFPLRVKTYLSQLLKKPHFIDENVITPYGYFIDFVINLNEKEEIVAPSSDEVKRKFAIILLQNNAFTKVVVQLRGKYQLMKKHVEMLGYDVAIINFPEWMNLVYADERLDFLSNLIWPNKVQTTTDR